MAGSPRPIETYRRLLPVSTQLIAAGAEFEAASKLGSMALVDASGKRARKRPPFGVYSSDQRRQKFEPLG
jgi:hypothetical protein